MTLDIALLEDCRGIAGEAAALVAAAFPVPFLEMNEPYLDWLLGSRFEPGGTARAAIARDGGRLVAFVAAIPRPFTVGATTELGYVVSFLAVTPEQRGGGLATAFYGVLLDHLATLGVPVINYTVDGSVGDRITPAAYARAGFRGHRLEPLVGWGALRDRLRPTSAPAVLPPAITLNLARSAPVTAHLDADPRGSREVGGGARVTAAWRTTASGREPVLILELLPVLADASALAAAIRDGFAAFPDHGRQMTVPIVPAGGAAVAEAAGLRRLSAPNYHPWVWAPDELHPFLRAERMGHPIL